MIRRPERVPRATLVLSVLVGLMMPLGIASHPARAQADNPRLDFSSITINDEFVLFYEDARYQAVRRNNQDRPWAGAVAQLGEDVFRVTNGDVRKAKQAMDALDLAARQIREADRLGKPIDVARTFTDIAFEKGGKALVDTLKGVPNPYVAAAASAVSVGLDAHETWASQDRFTIGPGQFTQMLVNPVLADGFGQLNSERVQQQVWLGQSIRPGALTREQTDRLLDQPPLPKLANPIEAVDRQTAFRDVQLAYLLPQDSGWVEPKERTVESLLAANPGYANDVRTQQLLGLTENLKEDAAAILANQGDILRGQRQHLVVSRAIQGQVEAHRRETREAFQAVNDRIGVMHSDLSLQNAMLGAGIEGVKERLAQVDVKVQDIQQWVNEQREMARAQAALAEKLGAFDSTAGFLRRFGQVSGDPKLARFLNRWADGVQIAKDVEILRGRAQNAAMLSGLGKAALTMDTASVALQVIGFIVDGGGPVDLDVVILEELRKLSRDMHERFDRVDASLNVLHAKLGKLAEAIDLLRSDVRQARLALDEVQIDLTRLARDVDLRFDELRHLLREQAIKEIGKEEADWVRGPRDTRVPLTREEVRTALARFEFYATVDARSDLYRENAFPIREARTAQELLGFVPQLGRDPHAAVESAYLIDERLLKVPRPKGLPADLPHARVWARASDDYLTVLGANLRTYGHAVDSLPQLERLIRAGAILRDAGLGGRDEARWVRLLEEQEKATLDALQKVAAAYQRFYKDRLCALPEVPQRLLDRFYPADLDDRRQTLANLEKEFPPELLVEGDRPLAAMVPPELRAWIKLRQIHGLPPIQLEYEATLLDAGANYLMHSPRARFTVPGGLVGEVRLVADWGEKFGKALPRGANVFEPDTIPGFGTESTIHPNGEVANRINDAARAKGLTYDRAVLLKGMAADLAAIRVLFAKEVEWAATGGDKVRPEDFKALTGEEGLAVRRAVEAATAYQRLFQWHLELFAPDLIPTLGPGDNWRTLFVPGAFLDAAVINETVLALQAMAGVPDQLPLYHPAQKDFKAYRNAVLAGLKLPTAPPPADPLVDGTLASLFLARDTAVRLQAMAREQQRLTDLLDAASRRPDGEESQPQL